MRVFLVLFIFQFSCQLYLVDSLSWHNQSPINTDSVENLICHKNSSSFPLLFVNNAQSFDSVIHYQFIWELGKVLKKK